MTTYLIRRLLQTIPTLLGVTIITFLMIQFSPGDPIDMFYFDPSFKAEDKERLRTHLCLDRPLWQQYTFYNVYTGIQNTQLQSELLQINLSLLVFGLLYHIDGNVQHF